MTLGDSGATTTNRVFRARPRPRVNGDPRGPDVGTARSAPSADGPRPAAAHRSGWPPSGLRAGACARTPTGAAVGLPSQTAASTAHPGSATCWQSRNRQSAASSSISGKTLSRASESSRTPTPRRPGVSMSNAPLGSIDQLSPHRGVPALPTRAEVRGGSLAAERVHQRRLPGSRLPDEPQRGARPRERREVVEPSTGHRADHDDADPRRNSSEVRRHVIRVARRGPPWSARPPVWPRSPRPARPGAPPEQGSARRGARRPPARRPRWRRAPEPPTAPRPGPGAARSDVAARSRRWSGRPARTRWRTSPPCTARSPARPRSRSAAALRMWLGPPRPPPRHPAPHDPRRPPEPVGGRSGPTPSTRPPSRRPSRAALPSRSLPPLPPLPKNGIPDITVGTLGASSSWGRRVYPRAAVTHPGRDATGAGPRCRGPAPVERAPGQVARPDRGVSWWSAGRRQDDRPAGGRTCAAVEVRHQAAVAAGPDRTRRRRSRAHLCGRRQCPSPCSAATDH